MGGTCGMYGEKRNTHVVLIGESINEGDRLDDIDVDARVRFKTLNRPSVAFTGLLWFSLRVSGRLL
jgi:hypothetical protein